MSDITASSFVRRDLVPERAPPVKTTGFVGFLRTRLFNSPTNILLTIVSILLLWFTVVPAVKFLLVDAVWTGKDRTACLSETAGHTVGACWPFVQAKFSQFIYGFYPEAERWRVNLTFFLAALLLLPLLIPRLPAKGLNAGLFFIVLPVIAFFLLHGGGLEGFGVSWTAGLLSGFSDSIGDGGRKQTLIRITQSGHSYVGHFRKGAVVFFSTAVKTYYRDIDHVVRTALRPPGPNRGCAGGESGLA